MRPLFEFGVGMASATEFFCSGSSLEHDGGAFKLSHPGGDAAVSLLVKATGAGSPSNCSARSRTDQFFESMSALACACRALPGLSLVKLEI